MEISTTKTFKKWIYRAYTLAFSHSSISVAASIFMISIGFLQLTLLWIEEAASIPWKDKYLLKSVQTIANISSVVAMAKTTTTFIAVYVAVNILATGSIIYFLICIFTKWSCEGYNVLIWQIWSTIFNYVLCNIIMRTNGEILMCSNSMVKSLPTLKCFSAQHIGVICLSLVIILFSTLCNVLHELYTEERTYNKKSVKCSLDGGNNQYIIVRFALYIMFFAYRVVKFQYIIIILLCVAFLIVVIQRMRSIYYYHLAYETLMDSFYFLQVVIYSLVLYTYLTNIDWQFIALIMCTPLVIAAVYVTKKAKVNSLVLCEAELLQKPKIAQQFQLITMLILCEDSNIISHLYGKIILENSDSKSKKILSDLQSNNFNLLYEIREHFSKSVIKNKSVFANVLMLSYYTFNVLKNPYFSLYTLHFLKKKKLSLQNKIELSKFKYAN